MHKILFSFVFIFTTFLTYAQNTIDDKWKLFAVTEDGVEVYLDTTSIKRVNNEYRVLSKKVYATALAKENYKETFVAAFSKTEKKPEKVAKKMKRWDDLAYTIVEYSFDCLNKRFRTLTITDYSSKNKEIVKTKTPKNRGWTNIEGDDMGDLMRFFVCDYEQ
ncbi:hypothetical protein M2132_000459 [Dysgonomonas sp. PH5-45]|uniref:surface-adhesin E family protein n=1 Tax=unclassified Dysgonomonas TaxID=2630389 RepID=UPI0024770F3A|nr:MULTISPECIES: surface-adhesin E family protein [unclassified Dysgonomonas]MDH6354137.1 hypothetical protein [Dysgonomonas sp. PH5-45]MDH6387012.1 hypothetical protein [Dysgonomonas sp. PH5-37]